MPSERSYSHFKPSISKDIIGLLEAFIAFLKPGK
jgi:hypothetical protein